MSAPALTGAGPRVVAPAARGRRGPGLLTAAALLAAAVVTLPIAVVLGSLASPAREVWAHLWRTQLVELVGNTLGLVVGVGLGTLCLGTALAWLVVSFEFPGRRVFEWALVLPLALPAYVIGFVFLGIFEYAGPVQAALRALLGPGLQLGDPRSGWGVMLVMTLVLYPYVYTLGRAALLEQAPEAVESARSLGHTPLETFLRVTLPLARPALVAGTTLAGMEALADFGTVATFGYRTLTEGVYRVWHGWFDRTAATQLAAVLLGMAALLIALERLSRGRARFTQGRRPTRPPARTRLAGTRAALAAGGCGAVLALGFLLPVAQLVVWTANVLRRDGLPAEVGRALGTSLGLGAVTAGVTLAVALVLGYGLRLRPNRLVAPAARVAGLGYALPGAVIAVGVLLPLAALDHAIAAWIERVAGADVGLLLTGTAAALVFAYVVRFLAVSLNAVEASLARVPRSLDEVARSLGAGARRTLGAVHLPLVRRGLLAAALLVFLDVMKEMPATILLRPLGLDTLAVAVWQRTAESLWEEAAVPALALVLAGLVPVVLLVRTGARSAPVAPARAPGPEGGR
jgi:iron(III) transport system permease protein